MCLLMVHKSIFIENHFANSINILKQFMLNCCKEHLFPRCKITVLDFHCANIHLNIHMFPFFKILTYVRAPFFAITSLLPLPRAY